METDRIMIDMKTEPIEARCHIMTRSFGNGYGDEIMAREDAEEAVSIAFREGQSSPKIKQLEWDFYGTYYATSRMEYSIEMPFIDCKITQGDYFNVYEEGCMLWINGASYDFRTLDEAKAAAQAELEKRVMECLDL